MLAECAAEGIGVLQKHFSATGPDPFTSGPFFPAGALDVRRATELLQSNNLDAFYSALSVAIAADAQKARELVGGKDVRADLERSLAFLEAALYRESEFERALVDDMARKSSLGDDEIRSEFTRRFDIERVDLMAMPTDRSVFFAKVNHGYWEYMRAAYDMHAADREQFRDFDVQIRVRRLRTSGVTQYWARQLHRFPYATGGGARSHVALCVSLTAGTEPPAVSLRKELSPVVRGAAVGLLSMFEATRRDERVHALGDGSATRSLIFDRTLRPFCDRYLGDSEACLIVGPPHLKQVEPIGFDGALYRFVVPPTRVNETWKTVAATLIGYLRLLARKHRSITILGQGASIASLMALLFADIDPLPNVRLRFFDLGRVLDVAVPEHLQKQAWAKRFFDAYVEEGRSAFRTAESPGCMLATPI